MPGTTALKAQRRRRVFLAARPVFVGNNAQIRDRKAVLTVIAEHEPAFTAILQELGKERVVSVIQTLLGDQVFESELKAKLAFPDLYQVSAVRGLQHATSEQEAARSEAEAFREVSGSEEDDLDVEVGDGFKVDGFIEHTAPEPQPRSLSYTSPSLFPSYLSYPVQHKLLNTLQIELEQSCYDFVAKWLPSILEERRWTCAEAVELSRWSKVLPSRFDELHVDATSLQSREAFHRVLKAIHPLRHAAVHRLPTSSKGVEGMLGNALEFVKALCDTPRTFQVENLLKEFQARRQDMELHKNHLENQLDEELRDIQEQRAALDRREKEAKESMIEQDLENTKTISSLIADSIANLSQNKGPGETAPDDEEGNDAETLQQHENARSGAEPEFDSDNAAEIRRATHKGQPFGQYIGTEELD